MIYISTGGFKSETSIDSINKLVKSNIFNIELSGGKHDSNQIKKIKALKKMDHKLNLQVHNYFPPPNEPFVFNLASLNYHIASRSMKHAMDAINLASDLKSKYYSFHAGFLLDPNVGELGKKIKKKSLYDRNESKLVFIKRVNQLATFAKEKNITLLIENNVLSSNNLNEFGGNILLMVDDLECEEIMNNVSSNVKMLVDVAHLKVSANSLNFNKVSFLSRLEKWIFGYHLSDNDGKKDSNRKIRIDSWFWPYIKKNLDYYSIEVYGLKAEELLKQKDLAYEMIYNKKSI